MSAEQTIHRTTLAPFVEEPLGWIKIQFFQTLHIPSNVLQVLTWKQVAPVFPAVLLNIPIDDGAYFDTIICKTRYLVKSACMPSGLPSGSIFFKCGLKLR